MTEVLVLGPHPLDGWSMKRYSEVLRAGYEVAGFRAEIRAPRDTASSRIKWRPLRKFVAYIEAMVIFPIGLFGASREVTIHVADHSHAHLLLWPWIRKSARVTCHDLFAVRAALGEIPEHRTRRTGIVYQRLVLAGLRRASEVICVSATTRADVHRLLGGVPSRVVWNPLTEPFSTAVKARTDDDFALIVSSTGWRKRREYAIAVWRALREVTPDRDLRLTIVGQPLTTAELASAGADAAHITVVGGLRDEDLRHLYADAAFLIQASRYEGFGWPVIEANSQGTVAVCADQAIFREIGPWNVFVPEDKSIDWGFVMTEVVQSQPEELKARAREYSLERFASELAASIGRPTHNSFVDALGSGTGND